MCLGKRKNERIGKWRTREVNRLWPIKVLRSEPALASEVPSSSGEALQQRLEEEQLQPTSDSVAMADSANNGGEDVKKPAAAHGTAAASTAGGTAAGEAPPREASPAAAAALAATDSTATAPSEQETDETRPLPLDLKLRCLNPHVGFLLLVPGIQFTRNLLFK